MAVFFDSFYVVVEFVGVEGFPCEVVNFSCEGWYCGDALINDGFECVFVERQIRVSFTEGDIAGD